MATTTVRGALPREASARGRHHVPAPPAARGDGRVRVHPLGDAHLVGDPATLRRGRGRPDVRLSCPVLSCSVLLCSVAVWVPALFCSVLFCSVLGFRSRFPFCSVPFWVHAVFCSVLGFRSVLAFRSVLFCSVLSCPVLFWFCSPALSCSALLCSGFPFCSVPF